MSHPSFDASSRARLTYHNAHSASWSELIAERPESLRPISAHIPIQPIHSPDLIHVDAALNAVLRPIYQNEDVREPDIMAKLYERRLLLVQFALGNPPFVPNPLFSRMESAAGSLPLIRATYFAYDLLYELSYFSIGHEGGAITWIEGNVTNKRETVAAAEIRFRVSFPKENEVFDYHYAPFRWDAGRWGDWPCAQGKADHLEFNGTSVGHCFPVNFKLSWEESETFRAEDFQSAYPIAESSRILPEMRLLQVKKAACLRSDISPGQSASFRLAIQMGRESHREKNLPPLVGSDYEKHREQAEARSSEVMKTKSELVFSSGNWDRIFFAQQRSIKQLLLEFEGDTSLMPTLGGSSERHFIWVWEAVHAVMPLVHLGHFDDARRTLEFIFRLQDGGYPPEGRFTSLAGAIGTTGPRWANTTGAALALAQEYALSSGDEMFLADYLPKMIRAGEWIVGEIRATRKFASDGTRPISYGLMPWAHSTDGDVGHVVTFTDAYTYWGLKKLSDMLERIKHPRALEFAKECEAYRGDILKAVESLRTSDGNIKRAIPSAGETIYGKFDILISAVHLGFVDALDVKGETFSQFVRYFEEKQADGFFCAPMDHDVAYVIFAEFAWQSVYLRRGEWKKAFCTTHSAVTSGLTADTFAAQERVSKKNSLFIPWQPNACNSGRLLQMMINSIYFRDGDVAIIFGGVPWEWLLQNRVTALRHLNTPDGVVSLEAEMMEDSTCQIHLSAEKGLPPQIKVMEEYEIFDESKGYRKLSGPALGRIERDLKRLSFKIRPVKTLNKIFQS